MVRKRRNRPIKTQPHGEPPPWGFLRLRLGSLPRASHTPPLIRDNLLHILNMLWDRSTGFSPAGRRLLPEDGAGFASIAARAASPRSSMRDSGFSTEAA